MKKEKIPQKKINKNKTINKNYFDNGNDNK